MLLLLLLLGMLFLWYYGRGCLQCLVFVVVVVCNVVFVVVCNVVVVGVAIDTAARQ